MSTIKNVRLLLADHSCSIDVTRASISLGRSYVWVDGGTRGERRSAESVRRRVAVFCDATDSSGDTATAAGGGAFTAVTNSKIERWGKRLAVCESMFFLMIVRGRMSLAIHTFFYAKRLAKISHSICSDKHNILDAGLCPLLVDGFSISISAVLLFRQPAVAASPGIKVVFLDASVQPR